MIIKDYTPVFDQVTKEFDPLASLVFGRIWRFAQMRDGVCRASLQTLATETGLSVDTVRRRIDVLMKADYISEKEYKFGETRKLTPNYDVMHSMGLVKVAQSNDPPSTEQPQPLAETDTKIVVKDTKKDINGVDFILDSASKNRDPLEGCPPAHADLLRPYCEFHRYPYKDELKAWIAQADVWLNRRYAVKDVLLAIEYVEEVKWEYYQPSSINKAFGKRTADPKAELKAEVYD